MSDSEGVMAELSRAEIDSLMCCPASDNFNPAPGNRTAYIKIRLKALKLVRPLWVEDGDEVYFTWQRTELGDKTLECAVAADETAQPD